MAETATEAGHRIRLRGSAANTGIAIDLTSDELEILGRVANYYDRSMGPFRHIVRLTSSRTTRARFRFVAEEGKVLAGFVEASRKDDGSSGQGVPMMFTPRALISFWGRLLSSMNSPRSRRRLSKDEIQRCQSLSGVLQRAVTLLLEESPGIADAELRTRRTREQAWMREALAEVALDTE